MDIKEINIILEYLKLPKNDYYKIFLEKKLSKEGKIALKKQEKTLEFIDIAKTIDFNINNISILDSITSKIEKNSVKKNFSFNKVLMTIKEIIIVPIFVVTLLSTFSVFNTIKEKIQNIKSQNKNVSQVYDFHKKTSNYDYIFKNYNLNINKNILYFNEEDFRYESNYDDIEYTGNIKKYKNIFDGAIYSDNYLELLNNIEKRKMNYEKVENIIKMALLEQHEVDIINKNSKNGGK